MADQPDPKSTQSSQEEEERRRNQQPRLDQEIARRYDPARLSKIVVDGAGRGERLDLATRSSMEQLIPGHDFSRVRVFRGALAEEVTSRHQADAVTVAGTGMILMRESSRSAPGTTAGRALLAHELTHVAQAQRGMHFALAHGSGEGEHEHEAEHVEAQVIGGAQPRQAGGHDDTEQLVTKRRAVVERVIELMAEQSRLERERSGRDH